MSEVGVTRSAASGILGGSHEDHTGIIRDLEGGNQSGAGGVQGVVGAVVVVGKEGCGSVLLLSLHSSTIVCYHGNE